MSHTRQIDAANLLELKLRSFIIEGSLYAFVS